MENIKEQINDLLQNTNQRKKYAVFFLVAIIILIVYSILSFGAKKIILNKTHCNNIKSTYTEFSRCTTIICRFYVEIS